MKPLVGEKVRLYKFLNPLDFKISTVILSTKDVFLCFEKYLKKQQDKKTKVNCIIC